MSNVKDCTDVLVENICNNSYVNVPTPEKQTYPQFLVMTLSKINLEADAKDGWLNFVIIKCMQEGYGSGNVNLEKIANGSKPPPSKKSPDDYLFGFCEKNRCIWMKSYKKVGVSSRGPPSTERVCIAPGMIFSSKIFEDRFRQIFPNQIPCIPAFSACIVTLAPKNMTSVSLINGNFLTIKSCNYCPDMEITNRSVLQNTGFPQTLTDACLHKMQFTNGDFIEDANVKENSKQDWIRAQLSQNHHILRVPLNEKIAQIGRSADESIFVSLTNCNHILEFNDCHVRLSCNDERTKAITNDKTWLENIYKTALKLKALELLVIYENYKVSNSSNEGVCTLDGFALVDYSTVFRSILEGGACERTREENFEAVANALEIDEETSKDYVYYNTQHEDVFVCVVNQLVKNKNSPSDPSTKVKVATPIFHPFSPNWDEGYLAYIFVEGEVVAPFVFNVRRQMKAGLKRKFESIDKIVLSQLI